MVRPIPDGFKQVKSRPIFAISTDGVLINAVTGRSIAKHVDEDGYEYVVFYTYDPKFKKNERQTVLVEDLLDEAFGSFGTEWKPVPGYDGYLISEKGTVIIKDGRRRITPDPENEDAVWLYKLPNTPISDKVSIKYVMSMVFPETNTQRIDNRKLRRVVASLDNRQILRGVTLKSDHNSGTRTAFLMDGGSEILLDTTKWDIQWEDEFDQKWKAEDQPAVASSDMMIKIVNVPMTKEALLQVKRSGVHYPGPLRNQTIQDLFDYLLKALD